MVTAAAIMEILLHPSAFETFFMTQWCCSESVLVNLLHPQIYLKLSAYIYHLWLYKRNLFAMQNDQWHILTLYLLGTHNFSTITKPKILLKWISSFMHLWKKKKRMFTFRIPFTWVCKRNHYKNREIISLHDHFMLFLTCLMYATSKLVTLSKK